MQASLSNLIAKSQCAPAGNGRCYFVPGKTVSDVETIGSGNTNHRFRMWKAEVPRAETTGFTKGNHRFRMWKRERQPRTKNQNVRPIIPGRLTFRSKAGFYKNVDTIYDTIYYTFRKQGCKPITIPKHEPIKRVYIEMVRQIVESEEKTNEDAQ